ncbi:MAG TPA: transposase [Anaerolineales bacterium]|nr:transposase [Anaerolineales bacterium]
MVGGVLRRLRVRPCATGLWGNLFVQSHFNWYYQSINQFSNSIIRTGDQMTVNIRCDRCSGMTKSSRSEDGWYKRNGTRNLFMLVEPKAGFRHVLITRRRTKLEFAYAMPYLVDVLYPDTEWIDVVLDCLNTHQEVVLIEIFGKTEADQILSRIRFHHPPVHASWLNMAEIEIAVLEEPCLNRRLSDEFTLGAEVVA